MKDDHKMIAPLVQPEWFLAVGALALWALVLFVLASLVLA